VGGNGWAGRPGAAQVERLRGWIREDFGIALASVDKVDHGGDEAADLWRGVSADGTAYAVKLSGGGTPGGLIVSEHLAAGGVRGVVRPMPSRHGSLWSERADRRLSVVPWVSDDRALSGDLDPSHWTSFGELLARVHAAPVPDPLAVVVPREDHTHEQVAATVRRVDDLVKTGGIERLGSDDQMRTLVDEWCAAADQIMVLVEQADALARELRGRRAPDVLCHGDPHLGNMLVGPNGHVWLIDWDDAVLAPCERDLMFILGGGVLAFAPVSPQEQAWFFDGYGAFDVDSARLAYYRCTRALIDVADPALHVIHGSSDAERSFALSVVRGVLSDAGLVQVALSSLRDLGLVDCSHLAPT
jgi:spectinomycin phosphotransferase